MNFKLVRGSGFYLEDTPPLPSPFFDYIQVKKKGYKKNYSSRILTLDQYDFISSFFILYKLIKGTWKPLMVQRYLSKRRCEEFRLPFPILAMIEESGAKEERDSLFHFLNETKEKDVIYPSSFTIDPQIKLSPSEKSLMTELTAMFHYLESINYETSHFLTSSVKRFKTYRVLEKAGHQFLSETAIKKKKFENEEVIVMGMKELAPFCREQYLRYRHFIEEDLKISA